MSRESVRANPVRWVLAVVRAVARVARAVRAVVAVFGVEIGAVPTTLVASGKLSTLPLHRHPWMGLCSPLSRKTEGLPDLRAQCSA